MYVCLHIQICELGHPGIKQICGSPGPQFSPNHLSRLLCTGPLPMKFPDCIWLRLDPKLPGLKDSKVRTCALSVPALCPSVLIRPRTNIYLVWCKQEMQEGWEQGVGDGQCRTSSHSRPGPEQMGRERERPCRGDLRIWAGPCSGSGSWSWEMKVDQRPKRPWSWLLLPGNHYI